MKTKTSPVFVVLLGIVTLAAITLFATVIQILRIPVTWAEEPTRTLIDLGLTMFALGIYTLVMINVFKNPQG